MKLSDAVKKVLGKKEQTTPEVKKKMMQVVNVSKLPQIIGKVEIKPKGKAMIDVAEGGIGAYLMRTGVLVDAKKWKADETKPVVEIKEQTGSYQCPWCNGLSTTPLLAKSHVIQAHGGMILREIAIKLDGTVIPPFEATND